MKRYVHPLRDPSPSHRTASILTEYVRQYCNFPFKTDGLTFACVTIRYIDELPIAVVRPSMVFGAWREPWKGWTDSMNGPAGLVALSSAGTPMSYTVSHMHLHTLGLRTLCTPRPIE